MAKVSKLRVVLKDSENVEILSRELEIDNPFANLDETDERLIELLSRDFYTPTLAAIPTVDTLTYIDTDGSESPFRSGQTAIYPDASEEDGYGVSIFITAVDGKAIWRKLGTTTAELPTNIYLAGATTYDASCQVIKQGILE